MCLKTGTNGVLERVHAKLLEKRLIDTADVSVLSLDSTCIKVKPAAHGALIKLVSSDQLNSQGANTKNYVIAANSTTPIIVSYREAT